MPMIGGTIGMFFQVLPCWQLTLGVFATLISQIAGYAGGTPAVRDGHLFSAYLMMPLAMCTLGLLVFNW